MAEDAFKKLFEQQAHLLACMQKQMGLMQQQLQQQQNAMPSTSEGMRSSVSVPWPQPLQVEAGDPFENFTTFKLVWENYTIATGMNKWGPEKEEIKAGILLNAIGNAAMKKYLEFRLTDLEKKSETAIFNRMEAEIIKKTNIIYSRYIFNIRSQLNEESFDDYLLALRKLVRPCNYPDSIVDDLLRDRLVVGVKDKTVMRELLRQESLTLNQAINLCRTSESACLHVTNVQQGLMEEVNKINIKKSSEPKKCIFCGQAHKFNRKLCPAWNKRCEECGGRNHFKSVCKKKKHTVKVIDVESDVSDDNVMISEIRTNSAGHKEASVLFNVNDQWKKEYCMLDTGAQVCVMGARHFKKITGVEDLSLLTPSQKKLKCFNGSDIPNLGTHKFICTRKTTGDMRNYKIKFCIVNLEHKPLLSERASVALGYIKYCAMVSKSDHLDRTETLKIMDKYKDVFEGHGNLPGEVTLEIDDSVPACIQPARRIPVCIRKRLQEELDNLERDGIVTKETQHTEWVNNILIVSREQKFRICLDPIPLNKALKRPNFQFTTLDEMLPELNRTKVFSTVDAKKGFWQCRLTEASSKLTTFWTPFGRYRWLRLPFGLSSSPEIFQQRLTSLVKDLNGIEVITDDILIYGVGDTIKDAVADHNIKFEKLLQRLREVNCKLNKDKVNLLQTSAKFYGHVLSNEGLKVDESKVEAIKNMPTPTSSKDVLRFLGMIGYLSKFINNLSAKAAHLRRLTRKDVEFIWTKTEEEEFQQLKQTISSLPTLKYFDVNKEVVIECDASEFGLGAALYQDNNVISFASRCLTATEKKYAQIEKEMLAVVFACKRFNQYIAGSSKTIVKSDHRPLIHIANKPLIEAPKRLQMMLLTLQKYNVQLEFIQGKNNQVADALSRAPVTQDKDTYTLESELSERKIYKLIKGVSPVRYLKISDVLIEKIRKATHDDGNLQKLIRYIIDRFPRYVSNLPKELQVYHQFRSELSTMDGLICRNDQVLIPEELRSEMLKRVHISHNGFASTLRLARENMFWPGMTVDIRNYLEKCLFCAVHASSQQRLPLICHEIPKYPFQYISMDVFSVGDLKFLVTVDHYSDYFELDRLSTLTANEIVFICKRNFARHGVPQRVCTDNATNFVNEHFKYFSDQWNFKHVTSSPHYPASNGKAEAAVKAAKRLVIQSLETKQDLWYSLLHHRNIPIQMDQTSPVQKLFSRRTRTGLPCLLKHLKPAVVSKVPNKIKERKEKVKERYDRCAREKPGFHIGQTVMVQLQPEVNSRWSRGAIIKDIDDRSFMVNVGGKVYRRNRVHIKPFPGESAEEDIKVPECAPLSPTLEIPQSAGFVIEAESESNSSGYLLPRPQESEDQNGTVEGPRRSGRVRAAPAYLSDFV